MTSAAQEEEDEFYDAVDHDAVDEGDATGEVMAIPVRFVARMTDRATAMGISHAIVIFNRRTALTRYLLCYS